MTTITAKMVSELRDKTNATLDICKLALVRTNGDMEAAEETIRVNIRSLTNNSEITTLRQRVAELEKERDKALQYWSIAEGRCDALIEQRDELLAAAEAIEIDAEECLDFDECTAMLVPIDTYHKLMEALASVKGGA